MPYERQSGFSGGLNTRLPAHQLPEQTVVSLTNAEIDNGEIRTIKGFGGIGGGKSFYYEKGDTWVNTSGFDAASYNQLIVPENTEVLGTASGSAYSFNTSPSISASAAKVVTPVVIENGSILTVSEVTWSHSSGTVTITTPVAHGLSTSNTVAIVFTSTSASATPTDTDYTVTVTGATTFTVSASSTAASGTCEVKKNGAIVGELDLEVVESTQGLFSANSFVEYNKDLFISRSDIDVYTQSISVSETSTWEKTSNSLITVTEVETGGHLFQDGDTASLTFSGSGTMPSNGNYTVTYVSTDVFTITGSFSSVAASGNVAYSKSHSGIESGSNLVFVRHGGTASTNDIAKIHPGDKIIHRHIPEKTTVLSVEYGNRKLILSNAATGTISEPEIIGVQCVPTRIVNGDLDNTLQMGFEPPEPTISISQIDGSQASRSASHSANWYTQYYPIPFQYGVSKYDDGTGAESSMSALTDIEFGLRSVGKGSNDVHGPLKLDISGLAEGGYALYRVGGTSSVIKRVTNFVVESPAITLTLSGTTDIVITEGNLPAGYQMRVRFYSFNGKEYNIGADSDHTTSGVSDWVTRAGSALAFTIYQKTTGNHSLDVFVEIKRKTTDDPFERVYTVGAFSWNDGNVSSAGSASNYIDFTPPRALIDTQPILESNLPPTGLKFLVEVNNFFFGAIGKTLYISDFAQPNSWPENGFLEFDEDITGLGRRGNDLIVFTGFGLYRVFGSAATEMRKISVPTIEGCPVNMHQCIKEIRTGVIYVSHYGICLFDGSTVTNLTNLLLRSFELPGNTPSDNVASVFEDRYYLLGPDKNGWVVDVREGIRLSRMSVLTDSLHYRGLLNRLYTASGYLGAGSDLSASVTTREFDAGDINREKLFRKVGFSGQSLTGTVKIYVDGTLTDTVNISLGTRGDQAIYLGDARRGNVLQVVVESMTGILQEISVSSDFAEDYNLRRYTSATIRYVGEPTVKLILDGATKTTTTLTNTTSMKETMVSFPAMSEGIVPHIHVVESTSTRLIDVQYNSEEI